MNATMPHLDLRYIIHDSTDNFSLCWPDLQTDKNNSHIYFYEILADPSQHTTVTKKYEIAYNIIIRGELNRRVKCHVTINQFMTTLTGPPVAPNLSTVWSEICFSSYFYFLIDYYIVKIINLIGDIKQTQVNISNSTDCIRVSEEYFVTECCTSP